MNFHVLTLFPDMIRDGFQTSITGRAVEKGLLSLDTVNIRDFSVNKHNRVDDYPWRRRRYGHAGRTGLSGLSVGC